MNAPHPSITKDHKSLINPNIADYDKTYKEFSWDKAEKELEFFSDDTLNIAHIAIDRHLKTSNKFKKALLYKSADGEKEEYTFEDLSKESNRFAHVLASHGVKKGERVFIFLPPIPERYIAFFGILKVGAIVGTLFSAFQEMALLDRLSDSEAKIVITNAVLYPRIQAILKDLPKLEKVIVVERGSTELPEGNNIVSYTEEMKKASETFEVVHMQKDDYSYVLYTSGTTGKPKGVVHAHGDILQAMLTTKYVLDIHDDDIYWCTADLGWVTGVVYGALGIWGLGGTQVIYEGRFSPENWYKILEEFKITVWLVCNDFGIMIPCQI